ncbi:hypothetical protein [Williamsia sp. CHRR-6]|uniref:hypothetical protein n=1 Tax=Williamsia sp. CHRR-6 TaxID=2835871 RepID=UPI001BDA6082|nr:hypothetical protein [Williamsia sp. CHRR-6]MBT0566241.1 hypothetical protein [Williamsia sp. CHRR-6]
MNSSRSVSRVATSLVLTLAAALGLVVFHAGDASALTNRRVCVYADYATRHNGQRFMWNNKPADAYPYRTWIIVNYKKGGECPGIAPYKIHLKDPYAGTPNQEQDYIKPTGLSKETCEGMRTIMGPYAFDWVNDICEAMFEDTLYRVRSGLAFSGAPTRDVVINDLEQTIWDVR